jgi:hypothetical protein
MSVTDNRLADPRRERAALRLASETNVLLMKSSPRPSLSDGLSEAPRVRGRGWRHYGVTSVTSK